MRLVMLTALFPLAAFVVGTPDPLSAGVPEVPRSNEAIGSVDRARRTDRADRADPAVPGRAAQRLASVLAEADSIERVHATPHGRVVAFDIVEAGASLRVTARTDGRGRVRGVAIGKAGVPRDELGALSWLSTELDGTAAIARLVVDEDGAVLHTSDDRRYLVIPGRGSGGGNAASEARWDALAADLGS